ncbi:MAG: hypothetical protein QM528_02610 [Phycisphaerales bacterium]|nr:hypothetical protein [Phycisphaerales bacterium]
MFLSLISSFILMSCGGENSETKTDSTAVAPTPAATVDTNTIPATPIQPAMQTLKKSTPVHHNTKKKAH